MLCFLLFLLIAHIRLLIEIPDLKYREENVCSTGITLYHLKSGDTTMSALFSSLPFDCPYPPDDRDPGPEVSRGERQQLLLRLLDGDHIVPSEERRYNDQCFVFFSSF